MKFEGGNIAHQHFYWDQASVLAQIGMIDTRRPPIIGIEQRLSSNCNPFNAAYDCTARRTWRCAIFAVVIVAVVLPYSPNSSYLLV